MNSAEQPATSTDSRRVTGTRALALTYMTYLSSTPRLHPGYRAIDAQWFVSDKDQSSCVITHNQQEIILSPAGHLVLDHTQITTTAISRIRNRLGYQPRILRILGNIFILCQTRGAFTAFLGMTTDKIGDSNFRKTHNYLLKEAGAVTLNHSGRPPKLY